MPAKLLQLLKNPSPQNDHSRAFVAKLAAVLGVECRATRMARGFEHYLCRKEPARAVDDSNCGADELCRAVWCGHGERADPDAVQASEVITAARRLRPAGSGRLVPVLSAAV